MNDYDGPPTKTVVILRRVMFVGGKLVTFRAVRFLEDNQSIKKLERENRAAVRAKNKHDRENKVKK